MVPSDKALATFYRLWIVTMSPSAAVWPQFLPTRFYARQQNASHVLSIVEVSVHASVCPSHCGIVSNRRKKIERFDVYTLP